MSISDHKVQMTVRFKPSVYKAVANRARQTGKSQSVVIAELVEDILLQPFYQTPETLIERSSVNVLSRIEAMERLTMGEMLLIKEILALFVRAYFNRTPAIPESERDAAALAGRASFARLLDLALRNTHDGISILAALEGTNVR